MLGNTGSLTRSGFAFTGWNTAADGSGATYASSASITISGSTTLFAKWEADTTNPVIGTIIVISNVLSDRLTVSWGAASDNITPVGELQYKLVKTEGSGANANIDTITEIDAISGADLIMDYTAGTTSFAVTGLNPSTDYHFAVLVRDGAGLKANYSAVTQTTPAAIWSHQAYLKAPNTTDNDRFGLVVSISGDTIAVSTFEESSNTTSIINGSDLSTTNDSGFLVGAVYVFRRTGINWVHEAYLKAPNSANADLLSESVSISGDTIVVGATWENRNTGTIINGSDLSTANDSGSENGAAYVFKRTGSTWVHEAYLKAPNTTNNDSFDRSVSISGDTIVVGAYSENSNTTSIINGSDLSASNDLGNSNGAAYVFVRE